MPLTFNTFQNMKKKTRKTLYDWSCIETSYALRDRHVTLPSFQVA